jgi:glycolate oxidase FAD binding subunit
MVCMSSEMMLDEVTVDGAAISRVFEPQSVPEATEVLTLAGRENQRLLLCGGRTRLNFGNVGGPFDAALSTRKLNSVIHYEPDDMTLAVEPGCTVAQIKSLLAEHNQVLALDAAHEESATIGASVATGLSSPRRLGSGSLKDWMIGIEVAGPDGAIARAGGMVVKNVTGFDMMHVHYGALGAFGLITRINLKVFPQAASSRSLSIRFDTAESAHAAGIALLMSQLQPSSVVVSNDQGWTLRVRCDAPSSAIERLVERIAHSASESVSPLAVEISSDGDDALVSFRSVVNLRDNQAVARLSVPGSRQGDVLATISQVEDQSVCADIGSGLVYVSGPPTVDWLRMVRGLCREVAFLTLPADLKRDLDTLGPISVPAADVIRRLKNSFDPNGILNHGRFVLGL